MHPAVELDIEFEDRTIDLAGGGYDLAVRIGRLADSTLVARRIAPVRKCAIASPAYLEARGTPERPAALAGHDALVYGNEQWRFRVGTRWETVRIRPRMRTNNGEMLRAAAQAGLGICLLPSFIAAPAIEDGSVQVILRDYPLEEGALHAVMPPGRAVTARVRALVDFLVARFGPEPAWDPCWLAEESAGRRASKR
jgi:DNA-binding transcriptional LysR family regulator